MELAPRWHANQSWESSHQQEMVSLGDGSVLNKSKSNEAIAAFL